MIARVSLACALVGLCLGQAFAANEPPPDDTLRTWLAAVELCEQLGGNHDICYMQYAPEELAKRMAKDDLWVCTNTVIPRSRVRGWEAAVAICTAQLAYIKQRWGY